MTQCPKTMKWQVVAQNNPVGDELFSYMNTLFCCNKSEGLLAMQVKMLLPLLVHVQCFTLKINQSQYCDMSVPPDYYSQTLISREKSPAMGGRLATSHQPLLNSSLSHLPRVTDI